MLNGLVTFAQSTYYTSSYSSSSGNNTTAGLTVFLFLLFIWLPIILFAIAGMIGMWKTFEKAGKPGWAAIVPVYNGMIVAEIAGRPSWWGLGFLVSPISLVVAFIFGMDIAKRFGRSQTFGIIGLGLFAAVGYCMIGFGKDTYNPEATPTRT
jgi:hypothetical protein